MSSDSDFEPTCKRRKDVKDSGGLTCIVHIPGLQYGQVIPLGSEDANKLAKLKDVRDRRLAQPAGSVHRMTDTCKLIPETLGEKHGFHRVCYQRFTMNLDRLKAPYVTEEPSSSRLSRRTSGDQVLFTPDCIFCNSEGRKKVKSQGTWTTEGKSVFDSDGWRSVVCVRWQKRRMMKRC